jgi:hypothetical protein
MKGVCLLKPVSFNPSDKFDLRWIFLLILVLLIIILAWPNPASGAFTAQTSTPIVTPSLTATITPIPVEYLESADQTSGVICGSVVLILIIVGGTFGVLRMKNGNNKH